MTATARVVSLVPSVTETLLAWGVDPVGVTRFCPPCAAPSVGGTKDPELARILALAPDVVVMCREENRRQDAVALAEAGVEVLAVGVDTLADVAQTLVVLADRVGVDRGRCWSVHDLPPACAGSRRRVVAPVWRRPWIVLGPTCYGAAVLAHLGLDVCAPPGQDRYPTSTSAELRALAPEMVVAPSEPYPFGPRHAEELGRIGPAVLVDGQDLFWWGVRTPDAVGRLAEVLDRAGR